MEEVSTLPVEFSLLQQCLGSVQDYRKARGRIHPLVSVLSLSVLALMAGSRSLSDIYRFGILHTEVLKALLLRRSPSVATLSRLLRDVSVKEVRMALFNFAIQLSEVRKQKEGLSVVAADGKTMKGVWEQGEQLHTLNLFAHQSALALDQMAVTHPVGETEGTRIWLEEMSGLFPGLKVLTGDALLAESDLCQAIVGNYKDYVLKLKKTNRTSTVTL